MLKKILLASICLLAPSIATAQQYEVKLPDNLPINEIDSWMMNHAISDQICEPLPGLCLSALIHKSSVISTEQPYSLSMIDGSLYIQKSISITGLVPKGMQYKQINYGTLKRQLANVVLPTDQQQLANMYLTESY